MFSSDSSSLLIEIIEVVSSCDSLDEIRGSSVGVRTETTIGLRVIGGCFRNTADR